MAPEPGTPVPASPDDVPPVQVTGVRFEDLKLIEPLVRALRDEGYRNPTPIQAQAIPHVLEGRDLLGCAQTGTGKTAAFALPILQGLLLHPSARTGRGPIRALILTPTRELASQIAESFTAYGRHTGLRNTVVFGGVGQGQQVQALRSGVEILVATPGRLLDLSGQGLVRFDAIEVFVLDEADRMLDMGFIHDVRRILGMIPAKRQTLLFSATMPPEIRSLADRMLRNPVSVAVTPVASTVDAIEQRAYFVERADKRRLLEHLLQDPAMSRALVFTRTKHGASRLAEQLTRAHIRADAIHGDKTQPARERALSQFKKGHVRVLVATDIAARGIDVEEISHVVNYDVPNIAESYVHRIGRTGRAGAAGVAITLCGVEERSFIDDIEKLIRKRIPEITDHPFRSRLPVPNRPALSAAPPGHPHAAGTTGGGSGGGHNPSAEPKRSRRGYPVFR